MAPHPTLRIRIPEDNTITYGWVGEEIMEIRFSDEAGHAEVVVDPCTGEISYFITSVEITPSRRRSDACTQAELELPSDTSETSTVTTVVELEEFMDQMQSTIEELYERIEVLEEQHMLDVAARIFGIPELPAEIAEALRQPTGRPPRSPARQQRQPSGRSAGCALEYSRRYGGPKTVVVDGVSMEEPTL